MKHTNANPLRYLGTLVFSLIAILHVSCVAGCNERTDASLQRQNALRGTPSRGEAREVLTQTRQSMGTAVNIQLAARSRAAAAKVIDRAFDEFLRVEDRAHPGREGSDVRQIHEAAGRHPVRVSQDMFDILKMALQVSTDSHGAFDITFAGVGRLWDFSHPDKPLPTREELLQAVELVGYRDLLLDEAAHTAFLKRAHMEIGLGAIAKGFAVDRAMTLLKGQDIEGAIVDAGGDMSITGSKYGEPWIVGIQHPRKPHGHLCGTMEIREDLAVVTSGDYERGFVKDGIRYHHILDPGTGEPARLCQSVTCVGPSCALADALATAIFVLGPDRGLDLLKEHYPMYDAYVLDAETREHVSPGFMLRTSFRRTE